MAAVTYPDEDYPDVIEPYEEEDHEAPAVPLHQPKVLIELTGISGVPSAYVLTPGDTLALTMQGVVEMDGQARMITLPVTLKASIG